MASLNEPITHSDISRGYYYGDTKFKKPGTPNGWVLTEFRGMSVWGDCGRLKEQYKLNPGTCPGGVMCPAVDCRLPKWADDFRSQRMMEFTGWLLTSDLNMKQKAQELPTLFKVLGVGGVLVAIALLVGTGISIFKISKK